MAMQILQVNSGFEKLVLQRALELVTEGQTEGILGGSGGPFPNIKIFIGNKPIHILYTLSDDLKKDQEKLVGKEVHVGSNQEIKAT